MRVESRGFLSIAALALSCWAVAGAQTPKSESLGTPEAKAWFDQAQAELKASGDQAKAAALYRKAIDADPRFVEAHSQFMFATRQAAQAAARKAGTPVPEAMDRADANLKQLYGGWAAAHPANPVYEWALGELENADWTTAEAHYRRAVELDPNFARAYQQLALIADFRGENQKQIDYLKQASDLNPDDPGYFFYWASAVKSVDPARSIALMQQVADRFPKTERGAQGLYWAAFETHDPAKKVAIYERLRRDFPPETFSWSESGMSGLFEAYATAQPDRALALANDVASRLTSASIRKTWQDMAAYIKAIIEATSLVDKGQAGDAVALVDTAPRPRYIDTTPLDLVKARARHAAGDTAAAYNALLDVATRTPSDALNDAMAGYARALGKAAAAVRADLWTRLETNAKPAPAFSLPDYPDGRPVGLGDYRGHVVLVNFWYPSCGPCRGEFPTLQRVLDKYKDRGFVILALNVYPQEDDMVMPYLRNNAFTFRPLKTDTDWAEKSYGARGFPSNYLVDQDGRIVFKPGVIRGEREQRSFELQIEMLLDRAAGAR